MRNLQIKGQNSHKLKFLIFVFSNRAISLSIAFGRRIGGLAFACCLLLHILQYVKYGEDCRERSCVFLACLFGNNLDYW